MAHTVVPHPLSTPTEAPLPGPARQPTTRRRLGLILLAVATFIAAVFVLGVDGLIPFGPLLAFSIDSDEEEARRSVVLSPRNVGLAGAMLAALAWFSFWYLDLTGSTLVVIAGIVMALPLWFDESTGDARGESTVAITKRSLILALWGVVTFVHLYYLRGQTFNALVAVCVILPLALTASRAWGARRGRIEYGLIRHPLRREVRLHLLQGLNIWLCCALLGGVLAGGGLHFLRFALSLTAGQLDVVLAIFAAGLVLLAGLALVPRRRVYAATNVVVALLSGFLVLQLGRISVSPTDPVVLDSPLVGEWFVFNGGRSPLLNGHPSNESNGIDFVRLGANGRPHTGGSDAPLDAYVSFGMPVLAPADGQIIDVFDRSPDNRPGTNSDSPNRVVVDIGGDRYVVMSHIKEGSASVRVGDAVRRGQPIAAVGNNGHSSQPHLHMHVVDHPEGGNMFHQRTYVMVFRDVQISRGGAWPWGDSRELRTGDLVRAVRS
jgi:hypothetical protein